jgi:hypothetical protein
MYQINKRISTYRMSTLKVAEKTSVLFTIIPALGLHKAETELQIPQIQLTDKVYIHTGLLLLEIIRYVEYRMKNKTSFRLA